MKPYHVLLLTAVFIILLGACEKKSDLTTTELIEKFADHIKDVDSYNTELNIETEVKDLSDDTFITQDTVTINIDMIEPTLEMKGKKIENDYTFAHYSTEAGSYIRDGEEMWADVSDDREIFKKDATTYADTAQTVLDLQNIEEMKLAIKDQDYVLTFKGKSLDVYEAFEAPFSLELVDINPEDMDQDVTIVIDQDTLVIKEIQNILTTEINDKTMLLSVHKVYNQINEIDKIDIPKGVIDEAKS